MTDRSTPFGLAAGVTLFFCLQLLAPIAASGQQAAEASQPPSPLASLPDVVARVDGNPITKHELLAQAQTMRGQAVKAGVGDPGQSEQFLSMVLDALISERLVYADSQTRGVGPSAAEVDQRVEAVVTAYGGEEKFEEALKSQGLDRQYVRRQVTQTLSFDHMMNSEIKPAIEVGEDAISSYYESNKDKMKVPTSYKLRRILKQVPAEAGDEVKQAARSQMEALRQQLIGGADFAALAKEHSDDESTREQGGEMPWIVLTGKGGDFDTLIAGLEVGDLSDVVDSAVGMFLIRLEDRKLERIKTLDESREEIVNILAAVEARRVIQSRVEALMAGAKVEILM